MRAPIFSWRVEEVDSCLSIKIENIADVLHSQVVSTIERNSLHHDERRTK